MTVLYFDSLLLESNPLDISGDADGKDDALNGDLASLAVRLLQYRGNAAIAFDEPLYGRIGVDGDALLGEGFARERRDLSVLSGKDTVEDLDHGYVRTKCAVEARKLDADRARADDEQRLGKALGHHRFFVGPDQLPVRLDARQSPGASAGRDNDVLGLDVRERLPAFIGDGNTAGAFQARCSIDHRDLVLAHQIGDAVRQALGHFAAALHHAGQIEANIVRGEPELRGALHRVIKLGGAE